MTLLRVTLVVCALVLLSACSDAARTSETSYQFDKFAWQLFIVASRPTIHNQEESLFWETWATLDDVFGDPNKKPIIHPEPTHIRKLTPSFKAALAGGRAPEDILRSDLNQPDCSGEEIRLNPTMPAILESGSRPHGVNSFVPGKIELQNSNRSFPPPISSERSSSRASFSIRTRTREKKY